MALVIAWRYRIAVDILSLGHFQLIFWILRQIDISGSSYVPPFSGRPLSGRRFGDEPLLTVMEKVEVITSDRKKTRGTHVRSQRRFPRLHQN